MENWKFESWKFISKVCQIKSIYEILNDLSTPLIIHHK